MRGYTHAQLVNVARKWLCRRAPVVVTEMASYGLEEADAIAFRADGHTTLIECKATRADFISDRKKIFRLYPALGMGTERYYLISEGVADAADLPDGWGLLVWDGRRVSVLRESGHFADRAHGRECGLLVSVVRRFGYPVRHGANVRCYEITSERRSRATLGVMGECACASPDESESVEVAPFRPLKVRGE